MHTRESKFIKEARIDAGLTQGELAKAFGYSSAQFISNAERSLCSLPPAIMKKFCKLTNADVNMFIHVKLQDYKQYLKRVSK